MEQILNILTNNQVLDQVTLHVNHHLLYDQRTDSEITYQSIDSYELKCPTTVSKEQFKKESE